MLSRANISMAVGTGIVLGCSLIDGGSTHFPAFILRLLLVLLIFGFWPRTKATCHQWELFTPTVALLTLLVGLARTPNISLALQPSITTIICIGVFITLLYTEGEQAETLLKLAVGIGAGHSAWAIWQRIQGDVTASGGFFNPNNFAALLVPLIVVALSEAIETSNKTRWVWSILGTFLTIGLACSASRSGLIALGVSASILLLYRFGMRALVPTMALATILGAILVWRQFYVDRSDPYTLSRFTLWKESILVALEHPFGVGLGGYHRALQSHGIALPGWVRYPKLATQAHSELFQAWVEVGWLGLGAILVCPFTVGLALLKRYRSQKNIGRDLALFFAFATPALASTTLHVPIIAALASVWAAAAFREAKPFGKPTTLTLGGTRIPLLGIAATACLLVLLPPTLSHYYRGKAVAYRAQHQYTQAGEAASMASILNPWSCGTHLLRESLLFLQHGNAFHSSLQVAELGLSFPKDPRPIRRAIWLLDQTHPRELSSKRKRNIQLQLLRKLGNRTPKDALVWKQIAAIHLEDSKFPKAAKALDTCLDIEPHCSTCLAMKADLLFRNGNIQEAKLLARLALEADAHAPKRARNRHAEILSLSPKMMKIAKNLSQ